MVRIVQFTECTSEDHMSTVTLRDLYSVELHDLMNAEKQIVAELSIMASRATSARLRRAFEDHHAETRVQIDRLRLLLEQLNEPAGAVPSGAVAALIEDARRRLDDTERGETLDAALIAAAQRIEHYEIASYGTARSYAEALGDYDAVRILQQTLDEEGHTDHVLTKLAERGINQAAGDDLLQESTRYRSRLRFVGAKDVPEAREREVHLHNATGEHLGTLDGFVVDNETGRPIYYVIDSRGWFVGRRYVVPVGQIDADGGATALRTTLTRAELAKYPEFSPSAFTAMDDTDALRYERRLHRIFAPDTQPYAGRPVYENLPVYRTPTWLMTGVWMSDSSGFAVTPPRADSDIAAAHPVPAPEPDTGAYERTASRDSGVGTRDSIPQPAANPEQLTPDPGSERMVARGPSTEYGTRDGEDAAAKEPAKPREPRIEQYRER
jgi:ferritin-like metal-binding protein YciE